MTPELPDDVTEGLATAVRALRATRLDALFAHDARRVEQLTFAGAGLVADLSKERITPGALAEVLAHAERQGLREWMHALFAGEKVNQTEGRPALHTALRRRDPAPLAVAGTDVMPLVRATRERMRALAAAVAAGERRGATGEPLRSVVAIGIGGSDLGPRLVCDALRDPRTPVVTPVTFVSNVDPAALARALAEADPATTLFVVVSKTFTTEETLANATTARAWLRETLAVSDVSAHFVAVTAAVDRATAFGVDAGSVLPMWDWVGGRYSLWSAVGLPIMLMHGADAFAQLLDGAAALDEHFAREPLATNLPVVLGALAWWNRVALGHGQRVVVPYAHALSLLPLYLQQLSLESNGKRVRRDGTPVAGPTEPSLWGSPGTDGQHAYFQWLHQGTDVVPVEFVVPLASTSPLGDQHAMLVANAFAQAQALMTGRGGTPEAACPGDRPSTTVLLPRVDAWHVGALLALWEQRTFVEAVLYGINPFDQYGVELGKTLARPLLAALRAGSDAPGTDALDPSTAALLVRARAAR
ncbi:MAG: glucose-6-phosphate isomerase [Proteobacteria bacterium]|nr:glucose-6-phosphate isomerase [Pseudomonadota bacterium]